MNPIWAFFFLQFFSLAVASDSLTLSKEKSLLTNSFTTESSTDSINQRLLKIEYRNHRRDPLWPYENEADKAWDFGAYTLISTGNTSRGDYQNALLAGSLGRKFSQKFHADVDLGSLVIKNPERQMSQIFIGGLSSIFQVTPKWTVLFKINRDMAYLSFGPGDAFYHLSATHISTTLIYSPIEQFKLTIKGLRTDLSDKNIRNYAEAVAMYGISTGVPWVWIGFGGEELGFRQSTEQNILQNRYWSPQKFISFGPRFDANFTLTSKFSLSLAANFNRIKEDQSEAGSGYLLSPALIYGSREDLQIKFSYMRIESRQNVSKWSNESLALSSLWSF